MLYTASGALVLLSLLLALLPAQLHAQTSPNRETTAEATTGIRDIVGSLENIQQSIESRRSSITELRKQLKELEDPSDKKEIVQKIDQYKTDIQGLERSFELLILGGINLSILEEETDRQLDWRMELEEIIRPLLSTLKEVTAKPRQLDSLRRIIGQREDQLEVITRAIDSIHAVRETPATESVSASIDQLLNEWAQRREDTQRELEIARFRLGNLEIDRVPWQTVVSESLGEFLSGRGLTLLLAVIAGLAIWLAGRGLLTLYWRWLYRSSSDIGISRAPLVLYAYRLALATLIVVAIILILYLRGDVLLLTLAVIALAGVALSLRQTLPRYTAELRLLLGVGPVREKERLVLDNVPYLVESLSIFTVLRNPALEGVMRLPLQKMNEHASRPSGTEPWFPCEPDDYLLLADGSYGRVLRQSIEMLEVAVRDTVEQISTKDFLSQNHRNLSRDGFGIACTFGIDYRHQAICLDTVPLRLREAITARFGREGLGEHIRDMLVEFKEAGASSLDYQIYLIMDGKAARAYFKSQRLVQQACVDCCNREGWVIPFTQVTLHMADAAGPSTASA
jgi:hypothetical protein